MPNISDQFRMLLKKARAYELAKSVTIVCFRVVAVPLSCISYHFCLETPHKYLIEYSAISVILMDIVAFSYSSCNALPSLKTPHDFLVENSTILIVMLYRV